MTETQTLVPNPSFPKGAKLEMEQPRLEPAPIWDAGIVGRSFIDCATILVPILYLFFFFLKDLFSFFFFFERQLNKSSSHRLTTKILHQLELN